MFLYDDVELCFLIPALRVDRLACFPNILALSASDWFIPPDPSTQQQLGQVFGKQAGQRAFRTRISPDTDTETHHTKIENLFHKLAH